MRIDDDKEEYDEEDVSDVAHDLPDLIDGRTRIKRDRFDDEKLLNLGVESINGFAKCIGNRADEPADARNLVITSFGVIGVLRGVGRGGSIGIGGWSVGG